MGDSVNVNKPYSFAALKNPYLNILLFFSRNYLLH